MYISQYFPSIFWPFCLVVWNTLFPIHSCYQNGILAQKIQPIVIYFCCFLQATYAFIWAIYQFDIWTVYASLVLDVQNNYRIGVHVNMRTFKMLSSRCSLSTIVMIWYSVFLICRHIIDGTAGARNNSIDINFTRLLVTLFSFTMDNNYSCSNILASFSIQIFFDRQDQWWRVVWVKGSQGHEEVSCGEKK